MSNENQQPTPEVEQNPGSDKVSPFLSTPLPQGAPQGQQQSLQQDLTSAPTGSVPKYNLPRGANTGNVGATTHFGYQTVSSDEKAQKVAEVFHSVASKYDITTFQRGTGDTAKSVNRPLSRSATNTPKAASPVVMVVVITIPAYTHELRKSDSLSSSICGRLSLRLVSCDAPRNKKNKRKMISGDKSEKNTAPLSRKNTCI